MTKINRDMREAEKNLEGLEKCCGLCVLPWKRSLFEFRNAFNLNYSQLFYLLSCVLFILAALSASLKPFEENATVIIVVFDLYEYHYKNLRLFLIFAYAVVEYHILIVTS